jgi:hypothetical protein
MASLELRLRSDATLFKPDGPSILMHVLSDALTWGLGFTQSIDARWPTAEPTLRQERDRRSQTVALGDVLWTRLDTQITAAHLIAERARGNPEAALDMGAFSKCLRAVAARAAQSKAAVHAPPIGTGLSGARWDDVLTCLETELVARGIQVVIHCLGGQAPR